MSLFISIENNDKNNKEFVQTLLNNLLLKAPIDAAVGFCLHVSTVLVNLSVLLPFFFFLLSSTTFNET